MSGCHEGLSPVSVASGRNAASQWDSAWNHSLAQWLSGCMHPGLVPAITIPQRRVARLGGRDGRLLPGIIPKRT